MPPNMPEPRGMGFTMQAKVDADHAGDSVTRQSCTGFIVYLNSVPIYWLSKKQASVESLSFGSKFIAMKQAVELAQVLRFKIMQFGTPLHGAASLYCENKGDIEKRGSSGVDLEAVTARCKPGDASVHLLCSAVPILPGRRHN